MTSAQLGIAYIYLERCYASCLYYVPNHRLVMEENARLASEPIYCTCILSQSCAQSLFVLICPATEHTWGIYFV